MALSGRFPYLAAGDVMEVEIDGLGRQSSTLRESSMRCDGLVAVVTGGGSGIGNACVQAFVAAGARVGVLDLDLSGLSEDPRVRGVRADVADRSSLGRAVASVAEAFGGIDILVNNAGISAVGTVEEDDDEQWSRVLDVNVSGWPAPAPSLFRTCAGRRPRRSSTSPRSRRPSACPDAPCTRRRRVPCTRSPSPWPPTW
ncbi:SDR family NAD(P)-dependent oxidoreductase [Micromonospora sp. M12]